MAFGSIQNQNSSYLIKDDVSQILTNTNEILQDTTSIGGGVQTLTNSNSVILTNTNTINTNVNRLLTNTNVNNTASSTGTLSQKLSYIINQNESVYKPYETYNGSTFSLNQNILLETIANNLEIYTSDNTEQFYILSDPLILNPGIYKLSGSFSGENRLISSRLTYYLIATNISNYEPPTFFEKNTLAEIINREEHVAITDTYGDILTEKNFENYFTIPSLAGKKFSYTDNTLVPIFYIALLHNTGDNYQRIHTTVSLYK